jgi:hypothetical protein
LNLLFVVSDFLFEFLFFPQCSIIGILLAGNRKSLNQLKKEKKISLRNKGLFLAPKYRRKWIRN